MPHVGSSSAEDLASSDEIKVFKDEGEDEDEKRACWTDLTDLKSSLITEGDQEKSSQAFSSKSSSSQSTHQNGQRSESTSNFGKPFESPLGYSPFSYPIPHPPYPNGTLGQMANKMAAAVVGAPHSGSPLPPFMMPNMERFPQPPPAHMGIPPVHIETKAVSISAWMDLDISGIGRNPLYNLSGHGHQYSHSVLSDFTQQLQWHNPAMYHQLQFRGPYSSLPSASTFPSFGRSHLPMPSLSGHSFSHPSFLPSSQSNHLNNNNNSPITNGLSNGQKTLSQSSPSNGTTANSNLLVNGSNNHSPQASSSHNRLGGSNSSLNSSSNIARNNHNNNNDISIRNKNKCNSNSFSNNGNSNGSNKQDKHSSGHSSDGHSDREHSSNKSHIKKPLNAFMIYMREMRAKVIAESTLKESAAINQILGKRWHGLSRVDQEKYYEKARKERELHMEMHPGWTAKDNYAINGKKKKKKRERNADGERGAMKKCRARYGLDQQNHWCKPCRRKKKCIRYMEAMRAANAGIKMENDDNLGSVGSVEAPTPESKSANESDHDNLNLSSTDLSLSSPPTSEYHHFINSFNNFSSSSAINSPTSGHLHLNGHGNGHSLHSSPSLFYSHHNPSVSATSLNSPIGSRMSSLLTPNSPLASSLSSFSSAQSMVPSLQAAATPSQSQMPPRNSPFSIEQLARPHCPQNRSSPLSSSSFSSASPSFLNSTSNAKSNGSVTVSVITQLPTPPSSTDSTSATPAMLSVA